MSKRNEINNSRARNLLDVDKLDKTQPAAILFRPVFVLLNDMVVVNYCLYA